MEFTPQQLEKGRTVPASVEPLTTDAYAALFSRCLCDNFRPNDAVAMLDNIDRWRKLGVMI